jgi:hypothetical protein
VSWLDGPNAKLYIGILAFIGALTVFDRIGREVLCILLFAFTCGWVWQGIQYLRGQPNLFQEEDGNAD